jgi:superfamily II DNA or RNA helicase
VVPAHLVKKWIRELRRFFGIDAHPITPEIGRDPLDLRADVDVWIVSLDLYTHNPDVRRKVVGTRASWSLAVFDEAHRLTPTSQYLGAAAQLAELSHHLLLLTATPHRGKEHYFRALLHLLDPGLYPWDSSVKDYGDMPQRPGRDNFLRRMKEDLRDLDGNPLFPPRFAETRQVHLTPAEADAYTAVMDYVDTWYDATSVLARSIYGKRAASCIPSALATLKRRAALLGASQAGKVDPVAPHGFDRPDFDGADLDSDEAWEAAEQSVLQTRSRDRRAELDAVQGIIGQLEHALTSKDEPAKWQAAKKLLADHGITPASGGQLLVFSEFADTARWLAELFRDAGFSTEVLEGTLDQRDRDTLQERFLAGDYQVLVSTDAGGEGIDLQSANVMVDWDIPWSLVRLEQRAGRLHRIGQTRPVHIYHLVAPQTREGRVQQVMLDNLTAAAHALRGRIYDLLDATADRAGFDYAAAMAAAQRDPGAVEAIAAGVPDAEVLVARAKDIVAEEDRLKSPVNTGEAMERFAADRLQAINPVIVAAFVEQVARTAGWTLTSGPAIGIKLLRALDGLPAGVAPGSECLVAADGASVAKARSEGFQRSADVVVLGPTEEPFQALVEYATRTCEADLVRGAAAVDLASLTGYTLFVYAADFEHHDGLRRTRRTVPFLVRYSGAGAFQVAWESVMNLTPAGEAAIPPQPAARVEADAAARAAIQSEADRLETEQQAITAKTRTDLDDIDRRHKRQVRGLPADVKRAQLDRFARTKAERLAQLDLVDAVSHTAPRLVGWIQVTGGARVEELGWDPNAEKVAISRVVAELERLGWSVDDRQTAGLGYDLFARRPGTTDQRLVEVKGFTGDLDAVVLEQHEWAQAQQRGSDYWLYVVIHCGTSPAVVIRAQDPAGTLGTGPKLIERYRIPVAQLRRLMEPLS